MSGRTVTACREAIKASDETAKAADEGPWGFGGDGVSQAHFDGRDHALIARTVFVPNPTPPDFDLMAEWRRSARNGAHIAANDPATRLALNAALTVVLDGIGATLAWHTGTAPGPCGCGSRHPCPDRDRALASLAAIAQALGVQP